MDAQQLTEALHGKWNGRTGKARCPAHDDKHPSMSISTGRSQDIVLHCFVCDQAAIIEKLKELKLWGDDYVTPEILRPNGSTLHRDPFATWPKIPTNGSANGHHQPATDSAIYDYCDESGMVLYRKLRKPGKRFYCQLPSGEFSLEESTRRVLYRLPELTAALPSMPVFIVEGEKDADALAALGFTATTNFDGAKGDWRPEYNTALAGKHIVIIPDNDDVGRAHADTVKAGIGAAAASVLILDLPGLPDKGDTSDWIDAGGTADALMALIRAASSPPQRFTLLTGDDIENMPPLVWLADDWLPAGGLSTLYGPSGAGKSFAALDLALSVANGTEWLSLVPVQQGPVVYVLAEGIGGLKQRQRAWLATHPDCTTENIRYVATAVSLLDQAQVGEIIAAIRAQFTAPVLIIIDTLARAIVGGDENSAKDMGVAVQSADIIRAAFSCHVMLVHHTGRNGDHERGSTALYGGIDASLYLYAEDGSIQLQAKKMKDAAEPEPIGLKLVSVGATDSCVLELFDATGSITKTAAKQLQVLGNNFPLEEGASTTQWRHASGIPDATFYLARTTLINAGFVVKNGGRLGVNVVTDAGFEELRRMAE